MISFNFKYLLKALPPNTVTLGVTASTHKLGRGQCRGHNSVHSNVLSLQHHLLKDYPFYIELFLHFCQKIRWRYFCGSISECSVLFHWSMCLSLCQYYIVLITVGAWLSLEIRETDSSSCIIFQNYLQISFLEVF